MNALTRLLAAAGLVAALSTAQATPLEAPAIRAASIELAGLLEQRFLFPDIGQRYGEMLRARAASGAYDALTEPAPLAATWEAELRALHMDAHLRVLPVDPGVSTMGNLRRDQPAFGEPAWLAEGVAYLPVHLLPGDTAAQEQMAKFLETYAGARALVLDLRTCFGGTLPAMDVLFARLFAEPTRLVRMDMRLSPESEVRRQFNEIATLKRMPAPAGTFRWDHWAEPAQKDDPWARARVLVLTDLTASACEHLAYSLKLRGRGTLIGATTRGAGHFGGFQRFGGQFEVFVPIGRTYDIETDRGWEGTGIAPDIAVPAPEALVRAATELGIATDQLLALAATQPAIRAVGGNPGQRRYGMAMAPPPAGATALPILQVAADSIAARAGLQVGDRILRLNGRAVAGLSPAELPGLMRGSPLTVVVERAGQELTFEMSLDGPASEPRSD
ncbi:MAG: S41 family peptidase [Steroidobacteraceae bacterium]